MRLPILFPLVLLTAISVSAQVQPDAAGTPAESLDQTKMLIPPPVSGKAYPNVAGSEERTNYLIGGVKFETAYNDNVYAGTLTKPVGETTFSVLPLIAFDRTTPRQKQQFRYSPGFTFYQPTSQLNAIDQNAGLDYTYQFSPYTALNVTDAFLQTSNLLGQSNAFSGGGVNGTNGIATQPIILPFAEELSNYLRGSVDKQFARNQLAGAGGSFGLLDYPNPTQAQGLFNSKTAGGTAFFAQRFSIANYVGAAYDYEHTEVYPPNGTSTVQTHSFMPYFTYYFDPKTSLSVSVGPEHYAITEAKVPTVTGWTAALTASLGVQRSRTNLNVRYGRQVTGGGGLVGAYTANDGNFSARLKLSRDWAVGAGFGYSSIKNVTSTIPIGIPEGHRLAGNILCARTIGEHFGLEFGYDRLHQSYSNISLLAGVPDSDRGYASLSYNFRKSVGQ